MMAVQVRAEKVMLQPLVMALPVQALPNVLIVPTCVPSQYTSHLPWQTVPEPSYVVTPTCATQVLPPLQVTSWPNAAKFWPIPYQE